MILLTHIFIAIAGLAFSTYSLLSPSERSLKIMYGFIAGTLISGTVLTISAHANLVQACMSGLMYTGFVGSLSGVVRYRLRRQRND